MNPDGTIHKRANHKHILGIVDFRNRTLMGLTNRGVSLYLFHPFDRGYPPFIVGSKEKPATNLICSVDFVSWDDTWPRGGIQSRLGPVGDPEVELTAVRLQPMVSRPVPEIPLSATIAAHTEIPWDVVLHIDPPGCEDVDDILAYRSTGDSTEYAIGIADVAAWIPEGSPLDEHAKAIAQTVYEQGQVHLPMVPNAISTDRASLRRDGRSRPVIALVITVQPGSQPKYRWEQLLVTVTHSYTYESVLLDAPVCDRIKALLYALDSVSRDDPHEWIERLMVEYNCRVAGVLRRAGVGILRSHKGTSSSDYEALAAKTGIAELAHFGKSAGVYCHSTDADVAHAGLGLAEYCHASSPIRRYVDLVNQRWIKHLLFDAAKPAAPVSLLHLHRRARVAKQMELDLWFRSHIAYDRVTEAKGVIVEHKQDTRYAVYVPEWRRKLTGVSPIPLEPGSSVTISIFIDKANPRWYDRVIASLEAAV
jgi:exoribonuclease R